MDAQLSHARSRPQPICAGRADIHRELFDELIRQVTVECPERGLLLLRMRDEACMGLDTWAELARDGVEFSRVHADAAAAGIVEVQQELTELHDAIAGLQVQLQGLSVNHRAIESGVALTQSLQREARERETAEAEAEHAALEACIRRVQQQQAQLLQAEQEKQQRLSAGYSRIESLSDGAAP
ncbi:axonemal dynein light chain-domain-containing protein [Tribonema minus]|uniref:Axonemal dynein light chain-domain-containing protein n=1 Tax=Tribonema minus TaxID=303371 RepID=A0A835YWX9_9STRA|nr:axonemal dynein light chain-domain-containing protein [Tribonema minus]